MWHDYDGGRLYCGEALEALRSLPDNCAGGVVTDPPYGINMSMRKAWDQDLPDPAIWSELLRVCRPGSHAVVFSSTRTIHRLMVELEDRGWQIRDMINWVRYGGMPKSLQLDRQPESTATHPGYGTALKPTAEPAVLVRAPLTDTIARTARDLGTGGLNIAATRFKPGDPAWIGPEVELSARRNNGRSGVVYGDDRAFVTTPDPGGRWPSNVYQSPKASRAEREQYCEGLPLHSRTDVTGRSEGTAGVNHGRAGVMRTGKFRNPHPTVKPRALIRWLLRLVAPPRSYNLPILDPFCGSGTAALAGIEERIPVWSCERDQDYQRLIIHRINNATRQGELF